MRKLLDFAARTVGEVVEAEVRIESPDPEATDLGVSIAMELPSWLHR